VGKSEASIGILTNIWVNNASNWISILWIHPQAKTEGYQWFYPRSAVRYILFTSRVKESPIDKLPATGSSGALSKEVKIFGYLAFP
jgi:hypothetical protein